LSLVHLRDRHPQVRASLGEGAFISPRALAWLLSGRYRSVPDPRFTGLATPARVSVLVILWAVGMSGLLWLWSEVVG